jgi:hypothetical protein
MGIMLEYKNAQSDGVPVQDWFQSLWCVTTKPESAEQSESTSSIVCQTDSPKLFDAARQLV